MNLGLDLGQAPYVRGTRAICKLFDSGSERRAGCHYFKFFSHGRASPCNHNEELCESLDIRNRGDGGVAVLRSSIPILCREVFSKFPNESANR